MTYAPRNIPTDPAALPDFLRAEFQRLSEYLSAQWDLSRFHRVEAEPDKPRDGDVRFADGTNWAPSVAQNCGKGFYWFDKDIDDWVFFAQDCAAGGSACGCDWRLSGSDEATLTDADTWYLIDAFETIPSGIQWPSSTYLVTAVVCIEGGAANTLLKASAKITQELTVDDGATWSVRAELAGEQWVPAVTGENGVATISLSYIFRLSNNGDDTDTQRSRFAFYGASSIAGSSVVGSTPTMGVTTTSLSIHPICCEPWSDPG